MHGGSIRCSPISSATPPLALASPSSPSVSTSSANKSTIGSMLPILIRFLTQLFCFPFFNSLHTLLYLIENLLKGIGGTERTCSRSRVPFSILYNYSNLRMIDQLSSVHCEIRSNTPGLLTTTRLIALAGESRGSPLNVWTDALHSIIT